MKILRLEVRDDHDQLIFVREKPMFAKHPSAIKSNNTRLLNWAVREFPDAKTVEINLLEKQ